MDNPVISLGFDTNKGMSELISELSKDIQVINKKVGDQRIEIKLAGNKKDLEKTIQDIYKMKPGNLEVYIDDAGISNQLNDIKNLVSSEGQIIGKNFAQAINKGAKNIDFQSIIDKAYKDGIVPTKNVNITNLKKTITPLRDEIDKIDLSAGDTDGIYKKIIAFQELGAVLEKTKQLNIDKFGNDFDKIFSNIDFRPVISQVENDIKRMSEMTQAWLLDFKKILGETDIKFDLKSVTDKIKELQNAKTAVEDAYRDFEGLKSDDGGTDFVNKVKEFIKLGGSIDDLNKKILDSYNDRDTKDSTKAVWEEISLLQEQAKSTTASLNDLFKIKERLENSDILGQASDGAASLSQIERLETRLEEITSLYNNLKKETLDISTFQPDLENNKSFQDLAHDVETSKTAISSITNDIVELRSQLNLLKDNSIDGSQFVGFEQKISSIETEVRSLNDLLEITSTLSSSINGKVDNLESIVIPIKSDSENFGDLTSEKKEVDDLKNHVDNLKDSFHAKTEEIVKEETQMRQSAAKEIQSVQAVISTINELKGSIEQVTTSFTQSKLSADVSFNSQVLSLQSVIEKAQILSRELLSISKLKIPDIKINTSASNNTNIKSSVTKEVNAISRAAEKSDNINLLSKSLNDVAASLLVINDCINIPDIFQGLKINKNAGTNLESVANALNEIKKSLNDITSDNINFLTTLSDITKQAETLKSLSNLVKQNVLPSANTVSPNNNDIKLLEKETTVVNNALSKTEQTLKKLRVPNTVTDDFSRLQSEIQNINKQLTDGDIDVNNYNDKITDLVNNFKKLSKIGNGKLFDNSVDSLEEANSKAKELAESLGSITKMGKFPEAPDSDGIYKMTMKVRDMSGEVQQLQFKYNAATSQMAYNTKYLKNELVGLPKLFESLGTKINQLMIYWTANFFNPYDFIQMGRNAINVIVDLDTALVDLQKTTKMNSSEMKNFYFDSNGMAKEMGVATKEIINQASAWSRLGYNTKAQAEQMAKYSSQFASISPGMSTDEAQTGLVSVMKAFDKEVSEVEDGIMSKINTVGNNFATNNSEIVTGLQKSSAAMAAMGQSFEDTVALFTAGQEILQDAQSMGTALRSVSMRIRGYDEETEELSEDLINLKGEVVDLTKTASNPQGISLFTDETQTHYKSMVQYLGEISEIWDDISEKNQTDLLQLLFAKTRAQAGSAIIKNFDQVKAALESMENSAGSADKEMAVIEQSLEYKINALKETWVGFAQNAITQDSLGNIIDFLTTLSEAISKVVEVSDGLPLILGGLTSALLTKNGLDQLYINTIATQNLTRFR